MDGSALEYLPAILKAVDELQAGLVLVRLFVAVFADAAHGARGAFDGSARDDRSGRHRGAGNGRGRAHNDAARQQLGERDNKDQRTGSHGRVPSTNATADCPSASTRVTRSGGQM